MRKSIISQVLTSVNKLIDKEQSKIDKRRGAGQYVSQYDARVVTDLENMKDTFMELLDHQPLNHTEFPWEFKDGGDAKQTSKVCKHLQKTAYYAVFKTWQRENKPRDASDIPAEIARRNDIEVASGLYHDDSYDGITHEYAVDASTAIHEYNTHISRFPGCEWLNGFEIDKQWVVTSMPFDEWANRFVTTPGRHPTETSDMVECAADVGRQYMSGDQASAFVQAWLYEPVDDGTYSTRSERILKRAGDEVWYNVKEFARIGDVKRMLSNAASVELIRISDAWLHDVKEYRNSIEFRVQQELEATEALEREAQELEEAHTLEKALLEAKQRKEAAQARIKRLLDHQPEQPAPQVEVQPAPQVEVTQLPYLGNKMTDLGWRDRLEMIKAQRH